MTSGSPEQTMIDNSFGIVTSKRVTYMAKKGWFTGGSREDVPLKQVVSVRYEMIRNIPLGLFCVVLGLIFLVALVGVIPLFIGILFLWGSPTVNVVTAGGTSAPVTGLPWKNEEAEAFAKALRSQLFTE